jgi:hypothetical protein
MCPNHSTRKKALPASALYDHEQFQSYLFELESALSTIGIRDCEDLHSASPLAAAVYCLLRATSLLRAVLSLAEAGLMDASDVVRRAYWESWMLGYEFRIEKASEHAALWHRDKDRHGIPDIGSVRSYELFLGITTSTYGKTYGGLSEVSHPTKSAAENSVVTISALHGDRSGRIAQAQKMLLTGDAPPMMYLLIWTIFSEWPGMISLGITPPDIPKSAAFYEAYDKRH